MSLNPYYTGSYSMRLVRQMYFNSFGGLNPYYTGSYSMSIRGQNQRRQDIAGLNPYYTGSYSMRF